MRKKIAVILAAVLVLAVCLTGCAEKTLTNYANLGYDLSEAGAKSVVFRVYHANAENPNWQELASFTCQPEKGHYADVGVEGAANQVIVTTEDNYTVKTEEAQEFFTDVTDTYELRVEGFAGTLAGCKYFEVKKTTEEQLYRLYPVNNGGGVSVAADLQLDKPYAGAESNLDNLLITIQFQ